MERTLSVEEKIRRAEEIYNRRNGNKYIYSNSAVERKKSPSLVRRLIRQIIICLLIYGVFYVVTNREYFLSQEFQEKVEKIAMQNETSKKVYDYIIKYIEKFMNIQDNNLLPEENNIDLNETSEQKNDENIGGAQEEAKEITTSEQSQEQIDVEQIKKTINFIKPIDGTISSTFGWRTPTTATVPKYHTGLDIAAKTGTIIKSATNGTVILVSDEGDYGKHYKIKVDNVVIIYAHCSKLYLKEGDNVTQGQEIAEVGSTGNSTRTTFTF